MGMLALFIEKVLLSSNDNQVPNLMGHIDENSSQNTLTFHDKNNFGELYEIFRQDFHNSTSNNFVKDSDDNIDYERCSENEHPAGKFEVLSKIIELFEVDETNKEYTRKQFLETNREMNELIGKIHDIEESIDTKKIYYYLSSIKWREFLKVMEKNHILSRMP